MQHLPPLESLRFFEAAARHRSFALAGKELGVTPAAVAHRIRTLEQHLDAELFVRQQCSVRIVSVEAVAEKWLLPRLPTFKAGHPGIAIEIETDHRSVDPARRDFDAWLAYTGETAAPRPVTRHDYTLLEETLYDEALLPVCSPALIAAARPAPGPGARARCATGRCSTTSAGTPNGPTGSPARARGRRTSRGPRAFGSTRCWSRRRRAGSALPSDARC